MVLCARKQKKNQQTERCWFTHLNGSILTDACVNYLFRRLIHNGQKAKHLGKDVD